MAEIPAQYHQDDTQQPQSRTDADAKGDGQDDEIICNYWERWGAIRCGLSKTSNGYVEYPTGVHHLGIVETSTAGVHNLVTDQVNLSKYDGETFVPQ